MSDYSTFGFQEDIITSVAEEIYHGNDSVFVQCPTGGGKTVIFSTISNRFYNKSKKRVLIGVHRSEIQAQTIKTLKNWYDIDAQAITSDTIGVRDRPVYVAMVETINRRILKNPKFLPPIGMLILDERHLGNFNKIHQHFQDCINIGFSATPLAANKQHPLKDYYKKIVCGPQIQELIKIGALVQNHTFSIPGVKRDKLIITNGKFDEKFMGDEFSKIRNVQNTIRNYEELCPDTKAICYNCNVEHSIVMHNAWKEAGYLSYHVDDSTPTDLRKEIFRRFETNPKAILNNVGIATMGYDNPSIQTVIVNRATTSVVLAIQMGGRGSRPFPGKNYFTILDMGGNYRNDAHCDWNSDRNWNDAFYNPPRGRDKLGAPPVKDCPNCHAIIAIQCLTCPICGFTLPKPRMEYDAKTIHLELVTKNIDVEKLIEQNAHFAEFYSLCQIGYKIGGYVKNKTGGNITPAVAKKALEETRSKAELWCKIKNRDFDRTVKWLSKKALCEAMNYNPDDLSLQQTRTL
jgi:superfamily II DNA or RNA helicase